MRSQITSLEKKKHLIKIPDSIIIKNKNILKVHTLNICATELLQLICEHLLRIHYKLSPQLVDIKYKRRTRHYE